MVRVNSRNKRIRTARQSAKLVRRGVGRRRGRRVRRGRASGNHYVETIPVSVELGKVVIFTVKHLVNRPKSMNYRIQYIHFVGTACYDLSTNNVPGFIFPSAAQLSIYAPDYPNLTQYPVASTGPVVLGAIPKNLKIHSPRQSDWLSFDSADTTYLGALEAICLGSQGTDKTSKAYLRGVVHILVKFGPEMVTSACPALEKFSSSMISSDDPDQPGSSGLNRIDDSSMPGISGTLSSGISDDFEYVNVD